MQTDGKCDEVWLRKLIDFSLRANKIPFLFETYNCYEVTDFAPTLTTKCGMLNGSSNVLVVNYDISK